MFEAGLKQRELEILGLLAEGFSNQEIANKLYLAEKTVRWYNSQIYSKLGVSNRQEAVQHAKYHGILREQAISENVSHNLPAQLAPFIGRTQELVELQNLIEDRNNRLITILAPGGMGKTRFALELAQQLVQSQQERFIDGIFFVPLQALTDLQQIVLQIADSIDYHFVGGDLEPQEELVAYLAKKQMLLVIDNWEHLLESVHFLTSLLTGASGLIVLATSREKLNISTETVYTLKSMNFPTWETLDATVEYEAVQLLVQACNRVKPDWTVTTDNVEYVVWVCRLTQGMPLGIVLAASWIDTLSMANIADEIQRNIDFLDTEMRDVPQRQRSIQAVFEYSWNKLRDEEQQVFMKLSVFRGGFTWEVVKTVAGASARILQALVNKALVTRDNRGRYDVHELLRQYAERKLRHANQFEVTQLAHGHYFAEFLFQRESALKGHLQNETIHAVEAEFKNIREMWTFAIRTKNIELLYQSAETLCWYCIIADHLVEGEQLLDLACTSLDSALNTKLGASIWSHLQLRLFWIRMMLYGIVKSDQEEMRQIEYWLSFAKDADNETDIALCYCFLGTVAILAERTDALHFLNESLDRFQKIENAFYCAWTLQYLYFYWESRETEKCIAYQQQALTIRRNLGGQHAVSRSLLNLAFTVIELGDLVSAEQHAQEMLAVTSARSRYGWVSLVHADLAFLRGDFDIVHDESVQALAMYPTLQIKRVRDFSYLNLGKLACIDGNYEQALDYYQQAQSTNPNPRHLFYYDWLLGLITVGVHDFSTAIRSNYDALHTSIKIGAIGRAAWCLPVSAMIDIHHGNHVRATQLLSLALHHPKSIAGWLENWAKIDELKATLQQELGTDRYNQIWENSKHLDLMQVISGLVADND